MWLVANLLIINSSLTPEPHHDSHELLSAQIGITASSATAQSQVNPITTGTSKVNVSPVILLRLTLQVALNKWSLILEPSDGYRKPIRRSHKVILFVMKVYNYDADLEVSDTCVRNSLLSWVADTPSRSDCQVDLEIDLVERIDSTRLKIDQLDRSTRL